MVFQLGDGQWDIPQLRRLLSEVLPDNEFFDGFEVEHDFQTIGHRVMVLNARRVDHLQLILLAIEDITGRRRAEEEREILVGELNHRVKNLFAVVRALATQADGARTAEQYQKVFLGRFDALARTHDLLFASEWRGPSCAPSRTRCGRLREIGPKSSRSKAGGLSLAPGKPSRSASFCTSWRPMPQSTAPSRYRMAGFACHGRSRTPIKAGTYALAGRSAAARPWRRPGNRFWNAIDPARV